MSTKDQNIIFQYVVRLAGSGGIFCSTKDGVTGKKKMFLMFQEEEKVYSRNALMGTWEEMENKDDSSSLWQGFVKALNDGLPNFTSANLAGI